MDQILAAITDWLEDNWLKFLTGILIAVAGWIFGQWRARKNWQRREFHDRLNVSLNSIHEGRLMIRTILEKTCRDVFLNERAAALVSAASHETTVADPLLPLPKDDYWYYLNGVLNEIAEQFADGQIRRDMGLPVNTAQYLICLTSECDGEVRTRKVRAMLIQRRVLEALPEKQPQLESGHHGIRWKTLQFMAKEWQANPWKFIEIELCR
jgi:hypothetical protein